jgi:hypothetical protein
MKLEMEIDKWKGFMRALRRDDSEAFEELMNHCRGYAMAAGAAVRPITTEAMFMSILLAHEKELGKNKSSLEKLDEFERNNQQNKMEPSQLCAID